MQQIEYRTIDKSAWPRGEWDAEPDKKQWQDTETGLPCLAVRSPSSGHWCGYVGVPSAHPLHGVEYSQESERLAAALEVRKQQPVGDNAGLGVMLAALTGHIKASPEIVFTVHGGLTFSDACRHDDDPSRGVCHIPGDGEPDNVWWFGFDCAHAGDLSPARDRFYAGDDDHYRNLEYVETECALLANQLAAIQGV